MLSSHQKDQLACPLQYKLQNNSPDILERLALFVAVDLIDLVQHLLTLTDLSEHRVTLLVQVVKVLR